MRFKNCVIDKNIAHAIKEVEKLLSPDSKMIKELSGKKDFKYNSGKDVSSRLLEERQPISVFTYRPWNPWTKSMGYFDGKAIHINITKLNSFDFQELCGLLLHEYAHYCGFFHGNNFKTQEKCLYSVPYYLSENITKW
jgi:hypothetical protein